MVFFLRPATYRFLLSSGAPLAVALTLNTPAFAAEMQTPPSQNPPSQGQPAQTPPSQTPPQNPQNPQTPPPTTPPTETKPTDPQDPNRIFGVLPNYTSVSANDKFVPLSGKDAIKIAALDSVTDPMVYPLYGFVAGVAHARNDPAEWGGGISGYTKRYGAALTDNTICSMVGTGLLPALLKQDPRYYQGQAKGFLPRFGYAAKASVVTKSRITGKPQFNVSEVAGTLIVASAGNLYYPDAEHTVSDTLTRWGMQAFWDSVSNELKEFWPDIKNKLHGK